MPKKKFTAAQVKRLKEIQSLRLNRAQNKKFTSTIDEQSLGNEQSGLLIAHHSTKVLVKAEDGHIVSCTLRQNLGSLVTGDNVIWQPIDEENGVVVACKPRSSVIIRPDAMGTKPIVANVDLMIIVVALSPLPQQTTLERYLILAHMMNINALIVINKFDLFSSQEHQNFLEKMSIYENLGYKVVKISSKTKLGVADLQEAIKDMTSILVGQSGMGKSSLLNTLIPNAKAQTNTLSGEEKLGRQTTTASKLYQLPFGGNLIDSPGIHQFNLRHLNKDEVLKGFKEFAPFLGKCQFRNCTHAHEPNCALIAAVNDNKIASFRLENFHAILLDRDAL